MKELTELLHHNRTRVSKYVPALLIIVEAFATLFAIHAREDHASQERWWRVQGIFILIVDGFGGPESCIQADIVEQGEGTHGIAAAQLHSRINIVAGRHAIF